MTQTNPESLFTLSYQEARGIFEPKTLSTQAIDTLHAAQYALQNAIQSLAQSALNLLQIDSKTFVAFPSDEFKPHDIALAYKNKCLHDDAFIVKILEN